MAQLYDGKYEFVEEIGKGGFGRVFKAEERITERHVAIKELHDKAERKQKYIIRELKTIAQFQRERVVAYFNHFHHEGKLFLVMEYCPNGNLKKYYKQKNIPGGAVNNVIKGVAKELYFIHSKNVIHRDIKPANLLVSESNMVKIADFGIANTLGGTPPYMSPEALQGDIRSMQDPRVDIYSLGVTMMELLTGKNPFYYLSADQILALHEKGDFPINDLPQWQQEVILKAIHKEPELRFQTMKEFAEAIRAKHAPFILNQDMLKAGEIAASAEKLLGHKKWIKAIGLLDHGENQYP
ncbi:MAG: serine/threonine-protein kinase [Balneolaceae bacterium]|nr:serine/threonine-protein kinase [Balneolaceae bacterium]